MPIAGAADNVAPAADTVGTAALVSLAALREHLADKVVTTIVNGW